MKKLNVLITGIGGPTPRSFARAIKEIGNYSDYKLIGTDIHKHCIGLYQKDLFDKVYITRKSTETGYWKDIETIIEDQKVDIAVILPEKEVYAWSVRQSVKNLPCKSLIPPLSVVQNIIDKGDLHKILLNTGFVPKSITIDRNSKDLKNETELKFQYPYWIRSTSGSSGLGSFKVKSFVDLERWIALNFDIEKFIISEFLPGRNLACKMLFYKDKLVRIACAERINYIMSKVSPSGITGNTSFGKLINDDTVFEISKKAMDFIFSKTNTQKHGFYTVDLKEDVEGKPLITEINIRHVAFTQCFAQGGANFCEDTIRLLDGDVMFDETFHQYKFQEGLIFLRDVDERPIVMHEREFDNV